MNAPRSLSKFAVPALLLAFISACSGGSGEATKQNVPPPKEDSDGKIVYNGPAPSTDDVVNFKINVWDNLADTEHCGACHGEGGQAPQFVRQDDINLAYAEANKIVDLTAVPTSTMITKVASGHQCWRPAVSVCTDTLTNYLNAWASSSGAEVSEIVLTAPPVIEVGTSISFPADTADFKTHVYEPILVKYCAECHAENSATRQQPFISSEDINIAYGASRNKINLENPAASRFVVRLKDEAHNCWNGDCVTSAQEMTAAIAAFAPKEPDEVDPALVLSHAMGLPDGIIASSGGRVDSNVVAFYEFKTGSGSTAFDTSGVEPSLDLSLTDEVQWVGSWGIRTNGGKAQGPTSSSKKLHSTITATGEYSIEAWVVPDNVAQDGPARIVTYSGGDDTRNFTLGQTTYDYNFLARSSTSDANGMPMISTPAADEVLQATLQHVVVNFDPINGRSIYVNGEMISENTEESGNLNDWDATFALAVGQEVDRQNTWLGTMRMLAIHNRVLSPEDIKNNFEVGVGEKFFLMFGISHLANFPEAYIVFEVQQYDDYSYLFTSPFFISLNKTAEAPRGLNIKGMHIGLNGKEVDVGQTYAKLDITINADNYSATDGVVLSSLGAVIPLDKGQDFDRFFLSFDSIGEQSYDRPVVNVPTPPSPSGAAPQSDIGVRTFDEINATLSKVSTVPTTNSIVADTFNTVRQQMPTVATAQGFLSSHQSGVMQLAVAYCTALVNDTTLRSNFFPDFNFSGPIDAAGKNQIIQPLLKALLAAEIDVDGMPKVLSTQPSPTFTADELSKLIDKMSTSTTQTAVTATCATALGSAVMLVQ